MKRIDYRGLKCPMPVLKAHKAIRTEKNNTQFEFISDDKSAPKDFKDLCKNTGYTLLSIIKEENYFLIRIESTNFEK